MSKLFRLTLLLCGCALAVQADLVGYWTFDDDTSDDSSGNGYHGTMVGGSYSTDVPTALAGGKSIDLTAGDHYVTVDQGVANGSPEFNFTLNMTVSCWVKGWPGNWEPYISKHGESAYGWQFRRYSGESRLSWTTRNLADVDEDTPGTSTAASDGNWHHIAATYDGSRKRIYVDGVLDLSFSQTEPINGASEHVVFGARQSGGHGGGYGAYAAVMMDDVAIFDEALSPGQIAHLASGGSASALPAASGLIYDFEDGTLQGWRNILVSRHVNVAVDSFPSGGDQTEEFVADSQVSTPRGSYQAEQRRTAGGFDELDGRHSTHLCRSPRFTLSGSGDLTMWLAGGDGPATSIANEDANLGLAEGGGTMRAYLRRESDGVYLEELRRSGVGNVLQLQALSAATLAPYVSGTETYTVDVVDSYYGGWGWIAFDEVAIPGTLAPEEFNRVLQFDVCQQRGTYLGTQSPAHATGAASASDKYWNGTGVDDVTGTTFFWANGAPATGVKIDFGLTTDGSGAADVDWGQTIPVARTDSASGVLDTYLMKDWGYSSGHNNLGVRISGLENGIYQLFALVREPNQLGRTYDVYMGLNISKPSDPGAQLSAVGAASGSTWTEGETYVQTTLSVNSASDYVTIIVAPTGGAQWATLEGIQIVNLTQQGSLFKLR